MQQLIRINSIRRRAEAIGLGLPKLCEAAGEHPSTVYRWLSGESEPRLVHYDQVCRKLETELERRERQVLSHLQGLEHLQAEPARAVA